MSEFRNLSDHFDRKEEVFKPIDGVVNHVAEHPDWEAIDDLFTDSDNGQAALGHVLRIDPSAEANRRIENNKKIWQNARPTDSWVRYDDKTGRWS